MRASHFEFFNFVILFLDLIWIWYTNDIRSKSTIMYLLTKNTLQIIFENIILFANFDKTEWWRLVIFEFRHIFSSNFYARKKNVKKKKLKRSNNDHFALLHIKGCHCLSMMYIQCIKSKESFFLWVQNFDFFYACVKSSFNFNQFSR